jgi:hypothetical protein
MTAAIPFPGESSEAATRRALEGALAWADHARAESAALKVRATRAAARSAELVARSERLGQERTGVMELALREAFALAGEGVDEVWLAYAGLGGDHTSAELGAYVSGTGHWPAMETNILAHVLNELLIERGIGPVAGYRL